MYSHKDIVARAWLVKEVVNSILLAEQLTVDKIFLIGSYASGKQTEWSDLDFLIQLRGGKQIGKLYPDWKQIREIHAKLDSPRIHVIFGTQSAAESLYQKNKNNSKDYSYKELTLGEIDHAYSYSATITQ